MQLVWTQRAFISLLLRLQMGDMTIGDICLKINYFGVTRICKLTENKRFERLVSSS